MLTLNHKERHAFRFDGFAFFNRKAALSLFFGAGDLDADAEYAESGIDGSDMMLGTVKRQRRIEP